MLKARKLLTATAVSLALMSTASHALTLGDIEMRSALNQPMSAQIRLQTTSPSEVDGLIVKLASQEAFTRAGLERNATLNDLRFDLDTSIPSAPVIRITSRQPVLEPFLNFLLEVDWPQGRMVREYTVLLDPPVFISPSDSQRATISENDVQRATDLSGGVPVAIDRSSGADFISSDEFTFDESSVAVFGGGAEVGDDVVTESFSGSSVEIIDLNEGQSVSSGGIAAETFVIDGSAGSFQPSSSDGEFTVIDATEGSGEFVDGQGGFTGEVVDILGADDNGVVSLTDSSVSDFSTASFATETIDGFNVEVFGDTREVSDSGVASGGSSGTVSGGEVVVRKGDTLFEIANRNKAAGVTTQQMMLALLEANQQAFINGNLNLVKAGAVLRIPDSGEASVISQSQAVAEVAEQEQLWREYSRSARGTTSRVASNEPIRSTPDPEETASTTSSAADTDALGDNAADGSSDEPLSAQEILEQARRELEQARGELRLVGDNEASATASSTSADESDQPDTENLSDINRKLQLAREELEASRLKTEELQSRDDALQGTAERMDSLVNLRQNEVAKLEQQLSDARNGVDSLSDSDATGEESTAAEVELIEEGSAAADSVQSAGNEAATAVDNSASSASRVVQPVESAANVPWWKSLLGDKKMLLAGGVGLLALLGLLFTMFRKRKPRDDQFDAFDEDDVEFMDEDYDGNALVDTNAEDYVEETGFEQHDQDSTGYGAGAATAAVGGTAAAAVAGAAMSRGAAAEDDYAGDSIEQQFNDSALEDIPGMPEPESNLDASFEAATAADSNAIDDAGELNADDTMSEADVYIAYGLHGQAEDLLTKAIAENPDQPEYQFKLMQTYHSQNNAAAFDTAAENYHRQFGAQNSPNWNEIASLGSELSPSNPLFAGSGAAVQSVGRGDLNAPKLEENDFMTEGDAGASSTVRDFSAENFSDESDLMDQTLDPGAAFAEADLEATGDFTQIAQDIRGASSDTLDFPDNADTGAGLADELGGFVGGAKDKAGSAVSGIGDTAGDAASGLGDAAGNAVSGLGDKASGLGDKASLAVGGAATGLAGLAGGAAAMAGLGKSEASNDATGDGSIEFDTSIEATELDLNSQLPGAGGASPVADDLTLDLDQLSGDLEMNSSDSGLEMPDLTSADLTADDSLSLGNADEMDTMMDLAKAYIDMGDNDSASSALGEIVKSGNPEQRSEAETLLRKIS